MIGKPSDSSVAGLLLTVSLTAASSIKSTFDRRYQSRYSSALPRNSSKAHRARAKATKTDEEVFAKVEEWFGERSHTLKPTYKKLAEPKEFMSFGPLPIALVNTPVGYEVK